MADLMHAKALARFLKVEESWVRSEAEAGRLPHVRAGDRMIFDPAAVVEALRERAQAAPAQKSTRGVRRGGGAKAGAR